MYFHLTSFFKARDSGFWEHCFLYGFLQWVFPTETSPLLGITLSQTSVRLYGLKKKVKILVITNITQVNFYRITFVPNIFDSGMLGGNPTFTCSFFLN